MGTGDYLDFGSRDEQDEQEDRESKEQIIQNERKRFLNYLGIKSVDVARLMCSGIAMLAADGDSKLVMCRGYIIFPKQKVFMEHWWTKVKSTDTIFDPLSNLMFKDEQNGWNHGTKIERMVIDESRPADLFGIGSFDCNVMVGECARVKKGKPRCEWCVARFSIISRDKNFKPYELMFNIKSSYEPRTW